MVVTTRCPHLGARIGATLVLHTWGSALTHHPHVHGIVPGGGLAPDGSSWIAGRPGFFLAVQGAPMSIDSALGAAPGRCPTTLNRWESD